jgi:voltage-gated potassium channel
MNSEIKPKNKNWRKKLYEIIYEADTPAGKWFDIILLILILLSVIVVSLESVSSYNEKYGEYFDKIEWIITILFTIEYILRVITIDKPSKYIFSFFGVIDFLSTIPKYISLFYAGANILIVLRALRLLRVFRILKLSPFVGESQKLKKSLKASQAKISVFLLTVIILTIVLGTIMYLVEYGKGSGFDNIPKSIYWAIVTLTTVGYGDIAPVTPLGQFIAALVMILGYGIIAVPTGIVSAEYSRQQKESFVDKSKTCPHCHSKIKNEQARYCPYCGHELNQNS